MDSKLCPDDQMATLLVDAPGIDATSVAPGMLIGERYVVQRLIGNGAFGAVFEARHTGTGNAVALKVLSHGQRENAEVALRRFFLEAKTTSALKHHNTVRVFDFGQDDTGLLFLAMELLDGKTLRRELADRKKLGRVFSEQEAIDLAISVTRSLGEAHAAGLVHRDLKPENIFLHRLEDDDPVIKVLDFGIVKLAGESGPRLTAAAAIVGTPVYMSPEQVLDRDIDGRSDLYSLGLILWEMIAGTRPWQGPTVIDIAYARVREELPDLRKQITSPISERFLALIYKALGRFPEDRFADAKEMRQALEACKTGSAGALKLAPESTQPLAREHTIEEVTSKISAEAALATQSLVAYDDLAISEPEPAPKKMRHTLWVALIGVFVACGIGIGALLSHVELSPPKVTVKIEAKPPIMPAEPVPPVEIAPVEPAGVPAPAPVEAAPAPEEPPPPAASEPEKPKKKKKPRDNKKKILDIRI